MPTTTNTPSAELRKLRAVRDRAHAELREAKAQLDAWDTEGLAPGISVGTAQGDLHAARREQKDGSNPHRGQFEAARAACHERDLALQAFKRRRVRDRIEEVHENDAVEKIRDGLRLLVEGGELYAHEIAAVRDIVIDTPGLTGQHYGHDPRPDQLRKLALEALDGEIARPGLTPVGEARLDD